MVGQFLRERLQMEREMSGCSSHYNQLSNNDCDLNHFREISEQILPFRLLDYDQVHLPVPMRRLHLTLFWKWSLESD